MNNFFTILFLILIVGCWFYFLINKKNIYSLLTLIVSMVIFYGSFSTLDIDLIIKFLFLFTVLISALKYGMYKSSFVLFFLLIVLLLVGYIGTRFDGTYTIIDNITSYTSSFMGFFVFCIKWPIKYKEKVFKTLTIMPLLSIFIGVMLLPFNLIPFFSGGGERFGGASLATNLAFFSVIGIISGLVEYKIFENSKYRFLAYVNFIIVCITLTRGGIIAGFLCLIPDIFLWFKQMKKSKKRILITIFVICIATFPMISLFKEIMERTLVDGEFNSSGRFEAWEYMIRMVRNPIYGNGLGFLKTATDLALKNGFNAAHNEYVRIYLETGCLGIIVYLFLFIYSFKRLIKGKKISVNIFYIFIILGFAFYSFTDNTITNMRFWLPFMFLISMLNKNLKKNVKIENSKTGCE